MEEFKWLDDALSVVRNWQLMQYSVRGVALNLIINDETSG